MRRGGGWRSVFVARVTASLLIWVFVGLISCAPRTPPGVEFAVRTKLNSFADAEIQGVSRLERSDIVVTITELRMRVFDTVAWRDLRVRALLSDRGSRIILDSSAHRLLHAPRLLKGEWLDLAPPADFRLRPPAGAPVSSFDLAFEFEGWGPLPGLRLFNYARMDSSYLRLLDAPSGLEAPRLRP